MAKKLQFLFVGMLLALFALAAACGGGDPAPTPAPGAPGQAGAGATDERWAERVRISYANPQIWEGWDFNAGDEFALWWSTKFNYELDSINLPWDQWHSMLSMWIMAQDAPDVAIFNYNEGTHADAANFVDQGLIKRFPDDWRQRWPGVASVHDASTLGPMLEELYGGVYFIPRARFYHNLPGDPLPNHWSLWMRGDWIEAVGFELRNYYTIPEVIEIGRRIRDQDPGGLGVNLVPLTLTPGNAASFFLRANSTHWDTFYRGPDGNYRWGAAHEATLEGLLYWYYAFANGILDPEFFLLTHEQDMEKFNVIGQAGIAYLGGQTADMEMFRRDFNRDTGHPREAHHIATLLGASGYYHQRDLINYWGAIMFSPSVSPAVFERWMDVMEFAATPDGYIKTTSGLKGVHWDRDADGNVITLLDPDTVLTSPPGGGGLLPSIGHVIGSVILWDDFAFDNPNVGLAYREESWALYMNRIEMSTPETFTRVDWRIWTHDSPNMRRARGIEYPVEFANMVTTATSREHLIELYNSWIAANMSIIQPVLDELNALD